jgi:uncharacterized cupin superfamily protein
LHATAEPIVIQPEAGTVTLSFGRPRFKIGRAQGSAGLGLIDTRVPPGAGFRLPHWHNKLEEAFYVLDGEMEDLLGDTWGAATAGSTIFIPAGCVHAWRNNSERPARQLVIGDSPDMLELIRELGTKPREAWDEISARYHTHLAYEHPDFPHK